MKRFATLAASLLFALPAFASDDPFADFRVPEHTAHSGTAQFQVSATHGASDAARNTGLSSYATTQLARLHDSDAFLYSIAVSLTGNVQTQSGRSSGGAPSFAFSQDVFARVLAGQAAVTGGLRAYPWDEAVGLDLSAFASANSSGLRSRFDYAALNTFPGAPVDRLERRDTEKSNNYRYDAALDATLGAGRVRDATVVYQAYLLQKRLLETGALARELSPATLEKIAALYYVQPDISSAHERPERFFWRELERILREDGALGEHGLDPYSVIRARESYFPFGGVGRLRGWFAGPVASLRHTHEIIRSDSRLDFRLYEDDSLVINDVSSTGERTVTESDRALVGGQAEYHRPLGWRWQLDAEAAALFPVRPDEHGQTVTSFARAVWFVADRWEADVRFVHEREWFRPRGADRSTIDEWMVRYGATVAYYIEDHTTISATLDEMQSHFGYFDSFSRSGRLAIGLTYRFWNAADAPGLFEPMRAI